MSCKTSKDHGNAGGTGDLNTRTYALLQKMLTVFEAECCISCARCHELRDEISELLACVPKNAGNETQNSLCCTDETQRRSVWHPATEVPQFSDGKNFVRLAFLMDDVRTIRCDRFYRNEHWDIDVIEHNILKWAYLDDLEAL